MPKRWLRLPNNEVVDIKDVFTTERERVMQFAPMPVIKLICEDRAISADFTMGPTRLLNGTRMNYLMECTDFEVEIDGSAYAMLGIGAHNLLEEEASDPAESYLSYGPFRMRYDLIEQWTSYAPEEPGSDHLKATEHARIVDYKVLGSYKVIQVLGVEKSGEKDRLDKDGNVVLRRRNDKWGKAGEPMRDPVYTMNWSRADMFDYQMQLGLYKIAAEANGVPITDGIWLYIIPRDGHTVVAEQRGVSKAQYMVRVPDPEPQTVIDYFTAKHGALKTALQESAELRQRIGPDQIAEFVAEAKRLEVLPPPCDKREAWEGRRCAEYCPARVACAMAGDNPWLKKPEEKENALEDF